ncbi:MAG TPA: ATP-binding cassette domain-containing protein [Acidimicrobiales bacterium]|nr:ATP-binding cassette domain-containing protein [Acidimicrobiales bacterium]
MLEVRDLRVTYGTTVAVDGVDLDVGEGEIVALLGPNGAGKTSALRAISRIVPSTGTIAFDGEPIAGLRPEAVARRGLVHVPEGRHVFPNLTVHENLLVGRSARDGRPSAFEVDDVYDLFPELVPLRARAGWALSGGEQQMVAIGRGLLAAPRLLLLDEPSLGLAPTVVDRVYAVLTEVAARVPLLLVEQDTERALHLAARAYVLAAGRVALAGAAGAIAGRDELVASYLGRTAAVRDGA